MAYVDTMKVFEVLRIEFEEKKAENIAHGIEIALDTHDAAMMKDIATKGDVAALSSDMKATLADMRADVADVKAELIRWMFMFWIGQFASIVGVMTAILFAFFKK